MENPTVQTDIAQILNKLDEKISKLDEKIDEKISKLDEKIDDLKIGQIELKGEIKAIDGKLSGEIKALDTKTEQLNIRIGNVEFAVRGVLIGIAVIVLGGFAMFLWMSNKL